LIILPSRFQTFLTNRSRSRSIPGHDRGQAPSLQKKSNGRSVFPVPPVSPYEQDSFGVTTDISTSSWTKSQTEDVEQGYGNTEQHKTSIWNPIRTLFPKQTRSFQTSFWSSVDRNGSPTGRGEPTRFPSITGFQAMVSRTEGAETTKKASLDEHIELLQVPRSIYQPSIGQNSEGDDITALPQLEPLPRPPESRFSPVKRLGV